MGGVILARIALVLVAAAAIFGLGTWLHQQREFGHARAAALAARTPAASAAAAAQLERSARHTPDTLPETAEAFVLVRSGKPAAAAAILRSVVHREPRNVAAWTLLAQALDRSDPAGAASARAVARRLSPPTM
jgi:cytochrome c-type biogenesis protein CcmH/NrfG